MSETNLVRRTPTPVTIQSLMDDFTALGVERGMIVLFHSSLSALGWVCGGPVAVILALENVLETTGTLVMPTHSGDLSDPANWENPPVPEPWWEIIRETMPVYSPDLTPTRGMGVIPECFRKQPGVVRSGHPQVSFAAWGARAKEIVLDHQIDFGLGDNSPLGKIYRLGGYVLLLGVGHGSNTSLHLAEYRAGYPGKRLIQDGSPVTINHQRVWRPIQDIYQDGSDFEAIGKDLLQDTKFVRQGQVAQAEAQLMLQPALVDYAVAWLERYRK
ncbi:MAG: AAC(3) family N-acetyltransferase [Anaerolineae bacterium]|nr:AAC(3) family N-acetyltransferase [Anaerolineae bacterium]